MEQITVLYARVTSYIYMYTHIIYTSGKLSTNLWPRFVFWVKITPTFFLKSTVTLVDIFYT